MPEATADRICRGEVAKLWGAHLLGFSREAAQRWRGHLLTEKVPRGLALDVFMRNLVKDGRLVRVCCKSLAHQRQHSLKGRA